MLSLSGGAWNPPIARVPTNPAPAAPGASGGRAASPILPGRLYLSDFLTAAHEPTLRRLRVSHRVSVCEAAPSLPPTLAKEVRTMHVSLADRPDVDILEHLGRTTEFIREALESEGSVVLVHCMMGISRSATVVAAYLLASRTAMSAPDAVAYVRARRGIVAPNSGFAHQLELYAAQLAQAAAAAAATATGVPAKAKARVTVVRGKRKGAEEEGEVDVSVAEVKVEGKSGRWAELGIRERMRRLRVAAGGRRRGGAPGAAPGG